MGSVPATPAPHALKGNVPMSSCPRVLKGYVPTTSAAQVLKGNAPMPTTPAPQVALDVHVLWLMHRRAAQAPRSSTADGSICGPCRTAAAAT